MKKSLLTAVLMVFCYCFSPSANAQPGVLDQTFGVGGRIISFSLGPKLVSVVTQPDGKIILSSVRDDPGSGSGFYGTLNRLNKNGSLDSSFNLNYGAPLINNGYVIYNLTLQPDQKILAVCHHFFHSFSSGDDYFDKSYLCRFKSNGTIDSTFATNGKFLLFPAIDNYIKGLTNVALTQNGKILVGFSGLNLNLSNDFRILQFNPNGTLDVSFGNNGQAIANNNIQNDAEYGEFLNQTIFGMNVSNDGKIYVGCGKYDTLTNKQTCTFMRFQPTGALDTTYGNNGFANANLGLTGFYFDAMGLTKDNKGLIVGHSGNQYTPSRKIGLICFDSSGVLDNNFGVGGKVFPALEGPDNKASALHIQNDGRIVITGFGGGTTSFFPNHDLLLLKLNNNGSLDSTYGKKGIVRTDVTGNNVYDESIGSFLQPDGKIILVGRNVNPNGSSLIKNAIVVRYDSVQRVNYNTLIASSFLDRNRNGIKDVNEQFVSYGNLISVKAGIDTFRSMFYVDSISVELDTGTYISRIVPYSPTYNVVPASHITSNTTYFHTDTVTFALQPLPGQRDASIRLVPLTTARAGFPNNYQIAYENKGTDTIINGTIQLVKSNKLIFNNSTPTPTTVNGDTLRWNISNLKPLESAGILVNFTVKTPPLVNIGDTLKSTVTITSNKPDLTTADNTSTLKQVVRGSYDPNDKTENHGGKITTVQVANGDYLQYTIRFQNTGNDTAFNVYIRDTLDNKLDWSTTQILTASHSYQMTITDGNKCLFTLRNINLVDSTTNEPGSHGYIVYKVKPKPTVALGDTIKNTAAIYFDYNLPVLTNTETTLVINEVLPLRLLSFTARKDNKTNLLNWTTTNEINVDHFEIQRSPNGREFSKIGSVKAGNTSYTFTDNNPLKAVNYYRLKMMDRDGKFGYSPVRMLSNNIDGQISIYPNPARAMVTVTHPTATTVAQLQLTDMTGRILRRTTVANASSQTNMNIKGLPAGKYNLTWSNGIVSHTQALVIE